MPLCCPPGATASGALVELLEPPNTLVDPPNKLEPHGMGQHESLPIELKQKRRYFFNYMRSKKGATLLEQALAALSSAQTNDNQQHIKQILDKKVCGSIESMDTIPKCFFPGTCDFTGLRYCSVEGSRPHCLLVMRLPCRVGEPLEPTDQVAQGL
eukprot:3338525-Amphidinium_carterae.1